MGPELISYHLIASLVTIISGLVLFRAKTRLPSMSVLLMGIILLFGLALTAILFPVDGFARVQLLAWGFFLYFPICLLLGICYFWDKNRSLSIGLSVILLVTVAAAVDSFLIEPRWLKVTEVEINSTKLEESLTIALLADIQADAPGEYEKKVLEIVNAQKPDLILLAGDYIQVQNPDEYARETMVLNQIFREGLITPDLGVFAVRGNVDWNIWGDIFLDLDVKTFEETETVDLGPVLLTGVGWLDSEDSSLQIPGGEKYHIVLGHSPNFSLGDIDGDLLLAGHTHGGQIQLPVIGPLLTLSSVPRSWASGLTEIEPHKFLLVSNGIGLERGYAPRMRFLCRPEVVILNLNPHQ